MSWLQEQWKKAEGARPTRAVSPPSSSLEWGHPHVHMAE
jgi:hypothetical protein